LMTHKLSVDGIPSDLVGRHGAYHPYISTLAVVKNQIGQDILFVDGFNGQLHSFRRLNLADPSQGLADVPHFDSSLRDPRTIYIADRGNSSFYAVVRSKNVISQKFIYNLVVCKINITNNLCIWKKIPGFDPNTAVVHSIVYSKETSSLYVAGIIYSKIKTPQYIFIYDETTESWQGILGSDKFRSGTSTRAIVVLFDGIEDEDDDDSKNISSPVIGLAIAIIVAIVITGVFIISKYFKKSKASGYKEASQNTDEKAQFTDEDSENDPHPL